MSAPARAELLGGVKRVVVKIGSRLIADDPHAATAALAAEVAAQRQRGVEVLVVTSGAIALGMQRTLDNAAYRSAHGSIPPTSTITTREALGWVTVEGARMLGALDRIGSLAPGKQADLVVIRASESIR